MFIDMNVLKRQAKAAFKANNLVIANIEDSLVVSTGHATVQVPEEFATNSFKSLIVEYLGRLPEQGESYTIGKFGAQVTTGLEHELDVYKTYSYTNSPVYATRVQIGDHLILQDAGYEKYAVPVKEYALFDPAEADVSKEGGVSCPRLTSDRWHIVWRNDGMALQLSVFRSIDSKAFKEVALVDLREENEE